MKIEQMRAALAIMNSCNCLSITEDDKVLIISMFGIILRKLNEMGINIATELSAMYELLKISTWDNGYFCIMTKKMCGVLSPMVTLLNELSEVKE